MTNVGDVPNRSRATERRGRRVVAAVAAVLVVTVGLAGPAGAQPRAGAVVGDAVVGDAQLDVGALAASLDYTPLAPARLADTRPGRSTTDGLFAGGGLVSPAAPLTLTIGGRGGVPLSGVVAVALNVTVTGSTGPGFLTAYPNGESRPIASNVNYAAGQTVANSVIAKLGAGNQIRIYSSASAHVIVDVSGYFSTGGIQPLSPARLADTRPSGNTTDTLFARTGQISTAAPLDLQVTGRGGVGSDATAVALNVTAVAPTGEGYLTVYPTGTPRPGASTVNFVAGQTVANSVIARVGTGGKVTVHNSNKLVHLVVDVVGYFTASSGYVPLNPARFADTRPTGLSVAGRPGPFSPGFTSTRVGPIGQSTPNGGQVDVLVAGRGAVPLTDTGAVVLNVTVTQPSGGGYLSVFPLDTERPTASSVNFDAGRSVPNLVVAKLGRGGGVSIYSSVPSSHIIVDVLGYFPGVDTADVATQWASIVHDELDMPISYDRCFPIFYQVNPTGASSAQLADVATAVGELELRTGIDFVKGPNSTEVPSLDRPTFDADGYSLPLLIAFTTPATVPQLAGGVVGIGGSSAAGYNNNVRWLPTQFLSGFTYFDTTDGLTTGFGVDNAFGKVALHELGHVVGLGHVDNTNELMNPFIISRAGVFGPGDLFGLGLLYATQGCPGSPATFGALRSGTGKGSPFEQENLRTTTVMDAVSLER